MKKPILLIDCDMVLLDFNKAIANAYKNKFNKDLELIDPKAFKSIQMYGLDAISSQEQEYMKTVAHQHEFWQTMPPMSGAIEFAQKLAEHFELVVLTSMPVKFEEDRMKNLQELGMPVSRVVAVARINDENPKKKLAEEIGAVLFIDDLAHNFTGLNDIDTKLVLLDWGYSEKINEKRDGLRIDHEANSFEQILNEVIPNYIKLEENKSKLKLK